MAAAREVFLNANPRYRQAARTCQRTGSAFEVSPRRGFIATGQAWMDRHPLWQAALSAAALVLAFAPVLILVIVGSRQS